MRLYESMMESCTKIDKTSASDGMGGLVDVWVDGGSFQAAIVKDSTMQARIAERQGVTEVYTVTVPRGVPLAYHDVFRRNSDSQIFRVTSNIKDSEAPDASTIRIGQVTAERWELT